MRGRTRRRIGTAIALLGGLGRLPAGGTFGALAALPIAWLAHWAGGFVLLIIVTAALWALGWWASVEYIESIDERDLDPPEVVIDEVAGQLLTLWPLSWGLMAIDADPALWPWPGWVAGFLLFRFFDIVKPWPISLANGPGGFLVMLDDVIAAICAGAIMLLGAGLAHGWF